MSDRDYELTSLSAEEIGNALFALAVISRQFAHESVQGTVRDYLEPHERDRLTPSQRFVHDVVAGRDPGEIITDDEIGPLLGCFDLPPLETQHGVITRTATQPRSDSPRCQS